MKATSTKPSLSVTSIPELPSNEFPKYSDVLVPPREELVDPEPDPVIEAFTKRAMAEAIKAGKLLMQDEVNQPVSYHNWGSEFQPKITLITKRPWLMPHLPIILPPTNITTDQHKKGTKSDATNQFPDISDSKSDNIPDHIDIADSDHSSTSSEIMFPVSDDHGSNAMDVVRSNGIDIPMSVASSDSDSGLVFPKSSVAM